MHRALALTGFTALLLSVPSTSAFAADPAPVVVTASDTAITLAPLDSAFVDTVILTGGTEYAGLFPENISVTGDCVAEYAWGGAAKADGVQITAGSSVGACDVSFRPHDTLSSTLAEVPGVIHVTVTAPPPPPAPPATAAPGPVVTDTPATEDAPAATAPNGLPARTEPPAWQSWIALVAAGLVTAIGSAIALARNRRASFIHHTEDEEGY